MSRWGAELRIHGLSYQIDGMPLLRRLELRVSPGQRHWIAGANGAGKSTLLGLISGARALQRGRIRLDGVDLGPLPVHRRVRLGVARNWQIPALFDGFTVRQQIEAAILLGLGRKRYVPPETVEILADRFSLTHVLDQTPPQLAYAERRLVDLALVFATPARLVLLDEPSAGLSRTQARALYARLDDWCGDASVVIVEHDHELGAQFAAHHWRLEDGRLTSMERCRDA